MNYIEHIIEPQKLLLTWQPSRIENDRTRRIVAELARNGNSADLVYLRETPEFKDAKKLGFEGYRGFSTEQGSHSNVLATFMRRLPSRKREDFNKFLNAIRIKPESEISDFALLGYSGARLPDDDFTVINSFSDIAPPFELLATVEGYRYHQDKIPLSSLEEGMPALFQYEPDNPKDPLAVQIMIKDQHAGYVCRGLHTQFHEWFDKGYNVTATVERINGTEERPQIYLYVKVRP